MTPKEKTTVATAPGTWMYTWLAGTMNMPPVEPIKSREGPWAEVLAARNARPCPPPVSTDYRPTPPCPDCKAPMVWACEFVTIPAASGPPIRTVAEVDASRHEPFCPQPDTPAYERAIAIRGGSRKPRP